VGARRSQVAKERARSKPYDAIASRFALRAGCANALPNLKVIDNSSKNPTNYPTKNLRDFQKIIYPITVVRASCSLLQPS